MAQRPPDLDEAGRPVAERPPDLDDQGQVETAGSGSKLLAGLGLTAAGAVALGLRQPDLAKKTLDAVLAARYIPMLSGFASPKSLAGNVGAAIASSAERGSMKPLKELLSTQTAKEFIQQLRTPTARGTTEVAQRAGRYNPFGRVMGAGDVATQHALERAGLTAAEAAEQTLQSPLPAEIAKPLSGTLGRVFVPFQRTPWNQFIQTFKATGEHPAIAAASGAAGAVSGATSENPVTPGLISPLAGRHSGTFLLGAIAGRSLAGGPDPERVGLGISPTSDTSLSDPILNPARPFLRPSARSVLKYLGLIEE